MAKQICFRCFKIKGDYEVCPHCGYVDNSKAEQAYQLPPGTVLRDRYIIGISIGIGGFGITYNAYDTVLGIIVAIKEFYPAGLVNRAEGEVQVGIFSGSRKEEFTKQLARFMDEAKNMAKFSKEKDIVNVFDYFQENHTAYIIMEYVDAPLLKDRLEKNGKMPVEEARGYMLALLEALSKVHYHGIIHKDIAPDNIFLTGDSSEPAIKLFDFGAAKFEGTENERTVSMVVKKGYTPPEQYRSKYEQGPFMDIYAAGAVFYEMVTGERPMEAPDREMEGDMKKPHELGADISPQLERVICKAMALKPEQRFATVEQFRNAILNPGKVHGNRWKWILAAGSGAAVAAAALTMILSQTVFSNKGRINAGKIQEDTIEVWLPASDEETGSRIEAKLQESMEQECPQVQAEVKIIDAEKYKQTIISAAQNGTLPEVFCTDALEPADYCEELSDLLNTMDLSEYFYIEDMKKDQEAVYELPTCVQAGVVYANKEKEDLYAQSFTADTAAVSLEELAEARDILAYADESAAYDDFSKKKSKTAWIAGDLSNLEQVKAVTVDKMPPTDFEMFPVLEDSRLTGCYKNCFGVNKEADENKRLAGMFLISLLLSDGMQSAAYMNNEEGIPVNRRIYDDYAEYKMTTYLSFLKNYEAEEMLLEDGGDMCSVMKAKIEGDSR